MTTAPPTRAVANLHLHLEYDSGLDVIAAAMASVPEGDEHVDEHRAHVAHDISSAVAHLLDIDAITPEGCPVRVTDVSLDVMVDIEEHSHEDDGLGTTPAERAEMEAEAREVFESAGFTEDEFSLIADGMPVAAVAGPPPFELAPPGLTDIPRFIASWGVVCGYLARANEVALDLLFDDLYDTTKHLTGGRSVFAGDTITSGLLPEAFAGEYTPLFYRKLIVTMVEVTTRLITEWEEPSNIAQVLALGMLLDEVEVLIDEDQDDDDADVPRPPAEMVQALRERLLDVELHAAIFDADDPLLAFHYWFVPFSDDERTAPYATDYLD